MHCRANLTLPPAKVLSQPMIPRGMRSEEHTSELQSRPHLVCRLLLEKKKNKYGKVAYLAPISINSVTSRTTDYFFEDAFHSIFLRDKPPTNPTHASVSTIQ